MEKSLNNAKKWIISNLKIDGFSNYLYDYKEDIYLKENNFIHQLKASRLISELSNQNNSFKEKHKINIDHILNNHYLEKNNLSYIVYQNNSDIIYNALFLRTLIISPHSNNYSDYIYKISHTIINFQNKNGSFQSKIYLEQENKSEFNLNNSEEIILSLIEMYNYTNNTEYLNYAISSQDYIIENYLTKINPNQYSILIPGHSKSLKRLYDITKNEKYSSLLKSINNKLIFFQETENLTKIGHFSNLNFNDLDISDSSLDGSIIEGFTDLYQIIENDSLNNAELFKSRILIGAYNLIHLQYNESYGKIKGAIKFNHNNHLIRIDSTQNAIEALDKILKIFNDEGNWNYLYYPELDLLLLNNSNINIEDNTVWYALFIGIVISIIFVTILYVAIKLKIKLK